MLYNKGNALKTKGGDRACPLPVPTPAHCDSALLPVPGSSQLGRHSGGGKPKEKAPWNVMSWC